MDRNRAHVRGAAAGGSVVGATAAVARGDRTAADLDVEGLARADVEVPAHRGALAAGGPSGTVEARRAGGGYVHGRDTGRHREGLLVTVEAEELGGRDGSRSRGGHDQQRSAQQHRADRRLADRTCHHVRPPCAYLPLSMAAGWASADREPSPAVESGRARLRLSVTGVLWPFGYGLSYTVFQYANLRVSPAEELPLKTPR